MRRPLVACTALGLSLMVAAAAFADTTPASDAAWPAPIARDLERIQKELGGSVVEQFSTLRDAKPQAGGRLTSLTRSQEQAVRALREAAAQLDMTANRLEGLELYDQADALRAQAQRLRLDARDMIGVPRPTTAPALHPWPTPAPIEPTRPAVHPDNERSPSREEWPRGPEIRRDRVEPELQPAPMPDR